MADTLFTAFSNATPITAAWLNDVNNVVYGAGNSSRGTSLLQFFQAGTGAGARIAQDKMREIITPEDYLAVGNGTSDDSLLVQKAINYAQLTGRKVLFNKTYGISQELAVTGPIEMEFAPGAQLIALAGFPNPASIADISWMINVDGSATAGSRFKNVNLDGNAVAGGLGIFNTTNVIVNDGTIERMRASGVYIETATHSEINSIHTDLCGVDPALSGSNLTTSIRANDCTDVKVHDCTVLRSGGKGIVLSASTDCVGSENYAIDCTASYGLPFQMTVATRCKLIGNVGIQGFAAGDASVCKVSINCNYCSLENNTFIQYGDRDIVVVEDAPHTFLTGNTIMTNFATVTSRQAIRVDTGGGPTSTDLVVMGNRFYGAGAGQAIVYQLETGVITGNHFENWEQGVSINASSGIVHSNSYVDCDITQLFGGSSGYQTDYHRTLYTINNATPTSGSGTFSIGYALPAYTLDRNGVIRVTMAGTKTGSNGNKTIAFRLGTTDVVFNAAANDTNDWSFEALVENSLVGGLTVTQKTRILGWNGVTPVQDFSTATEDTTTSLQTGAFITVAHASDIVTVQMMVVELLK